MKENDSAPEQVHDDRLYPSPRLWREGKEYVLKFRVLTPFRLLMIRGFIIEPLTSIWRFVATLLVIDGALFYFFKVFNVFAWLPFSRPPIYTVMGILLGLWIIERTSKHTLSRILFGVNFKITINDDEVVIKQGFSEESYRRHHRLGFAQVPFRTTRTAAYRNSDIFSIVIDDVRRDPLAEVFNHRFLEHIVTNANVALLLSSGQDSVEIDPVKDRMQRLRNLN